MWRDRLRRASLDLLEWIGLALDQSHTFTRAAIAEAILGLATPADWAVLTARSYDRNSKFSAVDQRGLFGWERTIIEELFPPAPARVLVGAAGSGREMLALAQRGYLVAGFEPGAKLSELARERVDARSLLALERLSYEQLIAGCTPLDRHAPYDAVILGWGSLSHVPSARIVVQVLEKIRTMSPNGPVLLSWVDDHPGKPELKLRAQLARLGVPTRAPTQGYSLIGGFSRSYTHTEIFEIAYHASYRVDRYREGSHPHALLVPRARSQSARPSTAVRG